MEMRMRKGLQFVIVMLATLLLVACTQVEDSAELNADFSTNIANIEHEFEIHSDDEYEQRIISEEELILLPLEFKKIYDRGVLIVAMYSEDRFPYFFVDSNGNLVGSDVDLAYDIAEKIGVRLKFVRTAETFDAIVDQVARGEVDLAISKLSITLPRAMKVSYTEPYLILRQTLLVNRLQLAAIRSEEENVLHTILQSNGIIGVKANTSYVAYAKEVFPKATIIEYEEYDSIMEAAVNGEIFAAFYDENEVATYIRNNPDKAIHVQVFPLENRVDPLGIAVSREADHFLSWLNQYLLLYKQKGDAEHE